MTREYILSMAREAGFSIFKDEEVWGCCDSFITEELERFAALVAASEREACAKVCDKYYETACRFESEHRTHHYLMGKGAAVCAYKIRARGQA